MNDDGDTKIVDFAREAERRAAKKKVTNKQAKIESSARIGNVDEIDDPLVLTFLPSIVSG